MANLAFDKSMRSFDADGRMHVQVSNISKAMVCPYYGREIPDAERMGLQADKIYYLLRDPVELEAAASTFRNLPLLIQHVPVSADEPRKDLVVGSTGSDVEYVAPYLKVSLSIWDSAAIAGVETKEQTELSSAYRYTADMTPGVYEGTAYDGVMRNIIGNHVALVDVGRAGPDVVVSDNNPFKGNQTMTQKQRLIAAKADARKALVGFIAQDADLADLDKVLDALVGKEDDIAEDESDDELYEDDPDSPGKRRKKVVAAADDADPEDDAADKPAKPEVTAAAMDKAIAVAVSKAKADVEALHIARREVAPMVGEVALDSAEAVYKFALDHAKVDVAGVHPSAYRTLIKMASAEKPQPAKLGMDAEAVKQATEQFPMLKRFAK